MFQFGEKKIAEQQILNSICSKWSVSRGNVSNIYCYFVSWCSLQTKQSEIIQMENSLGRKNEQTDVPFDIDENTVDPFILYVSIQLIQFFMKSVSFVFDPIHPIPF